MKANKILKDWGVVYNDNAIITVKTPTNEVFIGNDSMYFECDTKDELDTFISDNNLTYEYTTGTY